MFVWVFPYSDMSRCLFVMMCNIANSFRLLLQAIPSKSRHRQSAPVLSPLSRIRPRVSVGPGRRRANRRSASVRNRPLRGVFYTKRTISLRESKSSCLRLSSFEHRILSFNLWTAQLLRSSSSLMRTFVTRATPTRINFDLPYVVEHIPTSPDTSHGLCPRTQLIARTTLS